MKEQIEEMAKIIGSCEGVDDMLVVDVVSIQELDQALQKKSRECNMAIDKICLEHREEIRRLQEAHAEDLANVTRDLAIEIFFRLDNLIKAILLDNGDGTIAAVNTQEYIELKKKYMRK